MQYLINTSLDAIVFYIVWQFVGYYHLKVIAWYKDSKNRRLHRWVKHQKYKGPDQLE